LHNSLPSTNTLQAADLVLVKVEVHVISKDTKSQDSLLLNIGSPPGGTTDGGGSGGGGGGGSNPSPTVSLCSTPVFAGTCNQTTGNNLKVDGGCATTNDVCVPPEVKDKNCVVPDPSNGGYVTNQNTTGGGNGGGGGGGGGGTATFEGCCVAKGDKATTTTTTCTKVGCCFTRDESALS
jgi:hypothetical protein